MQRTIERFRNVNSLKVEWKSGSNDKKETTARVHEIQERVIEAVYKATEGKLDRLAIIPWQEKGYDLPKKLKEFRGLREMEFTLDEHGWACRRLGRFGSSSTQDNSSKLRHCVPPSYNDALQSIVCNNPGLEVLKLTKLLTHNDGGHGKTLALRSLSMHGIRFPSVIEAQHSPFAHLRHLAVPTPYTVSSLDNLWKSLEAIGTPLETLETHQVTLPLCSYLASFSGLRRLAIQNLDDNPECVNPRVTTSFFNSSLPRHSASLATLLISFQVDISYLDGRSFTPKLWMPALHSLTALKSLHLHPVQQREGIETQTLQQGQPSPLIRSYRQVIDHIESLTQLRTLEIIWPDETWGGGTGYERWFYASIKTVSEAVQELRSWNGVPQELVLLRGRRFWFSLTRWSFPFAIMALDLPPELIDKICSYLAEEDDYTTLNTCALVSTTWNSASRPYSSFRDLEITKDNYATFLTLLASPAATCTNTHIRSIQFDDRTRESLPSSHWLFTCLPQIFHHYPPQPHILSFHHFDFKSALHPERVILEGLTPNTLILDDCDFHDLSSLVRLLSYGARNSIEHISLNYLGFSGPVNVNNHEDYNLTLKALTLTMTTSQDWDLTGFLVLQPTLMANLTHLTILGAPVKMLEFLPHALALQSLTILVGLYLPRSAIDLSNHSSFRHLHLHATIFRHSPEFVPFHEIVYHLEFFNFPPSFDSLTLNLPANRLAQEDCWSATNIKSLFASKESLKSLRQLEVNFVEGHIYRDVPPFCPVDATVPDDLDPGVLAQALRTWKQKTLDVFEEQDRKGILRLGTYQPTLDDRLNTLYRVP
ncbi:hypothetical protein AX16_010002 [Volvariella volvacea WC 439]|nr:hypothetical protein AX16_010002 [Volvariella volvacea WC 439]